MSEENYFNSLNEILLINWWNCCDGDLTYTRINKKKGSKSEDWEAWCKIHDSYLQEFGINEEAKRVYEIRERIALLECDLVIDDSKFLTNEIRRLKVELYEILKRSTEKGLDRDGLVIQLEKWIGFRLEENKITARKFLNIGKQFEKEIERLSKAN